MYSFYRHLDRENIDILLKFVNIFPHQNFVPYGSYRMVSYGTVSTHFYHTYHHKRLSVKYNAKQKQPGCKKVRGQSEATMVISDQNL